MLLRRHYTDIKKPEKKAEKAPEPEKKAEGEPEKPATKKKRVN